MTGLKCCHEEDHLPRMTDFLAAGSNTSTFTSTAPRSRNSSSSRGGSGGSNSNSTGGGEYSGSPPTKRVRLKTFWTWSPNQLRFKPQCIQRLVEPNKVDMMKEEIHNHNYNPSLTRDRDRVQPMLVDNLPYGEELKFKSKWQSVSPF